MVFELICSVEYRANDETLCVLLETIKMHKNVPSLSVSSVNRKMGR